MFFGRRKRDEARIRELEENLDRAIRERNEADHEVRDLNRKLQGSRRSGHMTRCQLSQLITMLGMGSAEYPYRDGDLARMEGNIVYMYEDGIWNPHEWRQEPPLDKVDPTPRLFPIDGDRRVRGRFTQVYDTYSGWEFESLMTGEASMVESESKLDQVVNPRTGDMVLVSGVPSNHVDSCFVYTQRGWESFYLLNREMQNLGRLG